MRAVADAKRKPRRQWRDYRTRAGGRPVKAFLDDLTDEEVAAVVAGMKEVAARGLAAAKHLRGDIYEVRADAATLASALATAGIACEVISPVSLHATVDVKAVFVAAATCGVQVRGIATRRDTVEAAFLRVLAS